MTTVYLSDGTPIAPSHCTILDSVEQPLSIADRWAIRLADFACAELPEYSLAIATRRRLVAQVMSRSARETCTALRCALTETYGKKDSAEHLGKVLLWPPRMAAALKFVPSADQALFLRSLGVLVVYLYVPFSGIESEAAERLKDELTGRCHVGPVHAQQEARIRGAIVTPR